MTTPMRSAHRRRVLRVLLAAVLAAAFLAAAIATSGTAVAAASTETAPVAPSPLFAGVEGTDSDGVPLASYQHLPLDRGSALDGHATMTAWLTDAAWTWHIGGIALAMQLLGWVLGFGWVEWVLGPLDALRVVLGAQLGAFGWAPLALTVAALVGGIVAFRGRLGAGVMQLVVSAGCFALASTVMLAPLDAITGSETPVDDAKALGQSLADAVVDDVLGAGETDDAVAAVSRGGALDRLETRLIDLFVREAAQEAAFGAALAGTPCDAVFTEAMRETPPRPGDTAVVDAVGACDEAASAYASTPSLWQPFSVFVVTVGSMAVIGFVIALAIGLLGAAATSVLASIRAMVWIHVAILPGIGRRRFLRALADALGALVGMVVLVVAVASAAALIVTIADRAAEAGTPLTIQMACVAGATAAAAVGLLTIGRRLRDRGRGAADAVRSFVLGQTPRTAPLVPVTVTRHSATTAPT